MDFSGGDGGTRGISGGDGGGPPKGDEGEQRRGWRVTPSEGGGAERDQWKGWRGDLRGWRGGSSDGDGGGPSRLQLQIKIDTPALIFDEVSS